MKAMFGIVITALKGAFKGAAPVQSTKRKLRHRRYRFRQTLTRTTQTGLNGLKTFKSKAGAFRGEWGVSLYPCMVLESYWATKQEPRPDSNQNT